MVDYKDIWIKRLEEKILSDKSLYENNSGNEKTLINYCIYHKYSNSYGDCDTMPEIREYYKGFEKFDSNITPCGDTMISCQTFVNAILNVYLDEIKANFKNDISVKQRPSRWLMLWLFDNHRDYLMKILDRASSIYKLMSLYHSLNNFCPVPESFNVQRSGSFADWDTWNVVLFFIKEFYDNYKNINEIDIETTHEDKDMPLINMFSRNTNNYEDSIKNTKEWLKRYNDFSDFCKCNNSTNYIKNNKIKELYPEQLYDKNGNDIIYSKKNTIEHFVTIPESKKHDIKAIENIINNAIEIIR